MRAHIVSRVYASGMAFYKKVNGTLVAAVSVASSSMAPSEILRQAGCVGIGAWVGTTLALVINGEDDLAQIVTYELVTSGTSVSVLTEGHWPYKVQAYLVNLES